MRTSNEAAEGHQPTASAPEPTGATLKQLLKEVGKRKRDRQGFACGFVSSKMELVAARRRRGEGG